MKIELLGIQFGILEFIVIPLFLLLGPALLFLQPKIKITKKAFFNAYLVSMTFFLASFFLSYGKAVDEGTVLKIFLKWIEIFGLSLTVFWYCSSTKRFKHIWTLLIIAYGVDLLSEIIVFHSFYSAGQVYLALRNLGGYPALFLLCLVLPFSRRSFPIALLAGLLAAEGILSLSRGVWLGLLLIGGWWLLQRRYRLRISSRVVLLGIVLILILGLIPMPVAKNVVREKILNFKTASNEVRLGMAMLSLHLFLENPITGIGPGNFPYYLGTTGISGLPARARAQIRTGQVPTLTVHNFFLQVAAENGIIGLLAILSWLFVIYRILTTAQMRSQSPYFIGLRMLFVALIINLVFGYVAGTSRLQLGLYSGLVLATLRIWHKEKEQGT